MAGEKQCPDGQILNKATNRCVKKDGRIGRKLLSETNKCKEGTILNPETGRCVKIDGKIGRRLMMKTVSIAFEPGLFQLGNSSFDSGRSKSSAKYRNVWDSISIENYLKWYNSFSDTINKIFKKHHIIYGGFTVYDAKHLALHFQTNEIKNLHTILQDNMKTSNPAVKAIRYALSPDIDEEHTVVYRNEIYLVECLTVK